MLRSLRLLWVVVGLVSGCSRQGRPSDKAGGVAAEKITFIEDDYPRALAEARARKAPLVIDLYAPWCWACRYMEESAFVDPALVRRSAQFVWARLNVDRSSSEVIAQKYNANEYPMLLVINPSDERLALSQQGAATAEQVLRLLDDGERAAQGAGAGGVEGALAKADGDYAAGRYADAARGYRGALSAAPAGWPSRPRAAEALVEALAQADDNEGCAGAARSALGGPDGGALSARVAVIGLACALAAGKDAGAWRAESLEALEPFVRKGLASPEALFDNGAESYMSLIEASEQAGDAAGAERLRAEWVAALERMVAEGPLRAGAAASLLNFTIKQKGDCERLLPTFLKLEQGRPGDALPSHSLARCYAMLERWGEALDANKRALKRAPGELRATLLRSQGKIHQQKGDKDAARRAFELALAAARAPGVRVSPRVIEGIEGDLKGF